MKLLVDMNLSPLWAGFLTQSGFEAVHWSEIGAGNASDADLISWAIEHNHVLLTADLDFGAILAASGLGRPSVIQLRSESLDPATIGDITVAAIGQASDELEGGALLSVDVAKARLRILPLDQD